MKRLFRAVVVIFIALMLFNRSLVNLALAKQGCCSWHGGVSHCDTSVGRYVCNDGTYSPSCGCAYIPPKPKVTIKPLIPTSTPTPYRINTPTPYRVATPAPSNDLGSSDDETGGLLTLSLVALGGGLYWVYRRLRKESEG